jgi:MFS family permease
LNVVTVVSFFLLVFNRTAEAGSFCSATFSNLTECDRSAPPIVDGGKSSGEHPAYHMFVFAQLLSGVGSSGLHSLSLAYIDENAPRAKSAFYVGKTEYVLGM